MTDKELLELAAKAAGIDLAHKPFLHTRGDGALTKDGGVWNPLTDDGDALRLAVKVGIDVIHHRPKDGLHFVSAVDWDGNETLLECCDDPYAATRRAIVRAAAEIGRSL